MKTITGTAVTPYGMCGFGYVDEGLPKEEALAKLRKEMESNPAFLMFLSTLPKQKRYEVVKEIVDAVKGEPNASIAHNTAGDIREMKQFLV